MWPQRVKVSRVTFEFYVSQPWKEFAHACFGEVVSDTEILEWLLLFHKAQLSLVKRVLFV